MTNLFPGETQNYLSADSVTDITTHAWPIEFLNSLAPNGIPPHDLALKPGIPLILMRNISPSQGLCNGTRMRLDTMHDRILECTILNGTHKGQKAIIPRINLTLTESELPFTLTRRQFPVCVAFAMTINKSQGQTIDHVGVYLPKQVFSHGQLYVALSRCPTFTHLNVYVQHGTTHDHTANVVYKEIYSN